MDDQRKDDLDPKRPSMGSAKNNYRYITCLPMMWKILIAQIREETYSSLTSRGLFLEEQKGCRKGSRGTAELLYIDQHILNETKIRRENLAMAWIDYKKHVPAKLDDKLSQNVENIKSSETLSRKP